MTSITNDNNAWPSINHENKYSQILMKPQYLICKLIYKGIVNTIYDNWILEADVVNDMIGLI